MRELKTRKKFLAVRLETLEPRILLAGDQLVGDPLRPSGTGTGGATVVPASAPTAPAAAPSSLLPVLEGNPPRVVSADGLEQLAAAVAPAGTSLVLLSGQSLVGVGEVAASVVNSGVVAPGASPGVLSVQNYEQNSAATLKIEIAGTSVGAGGYDQVIAAGSASLAGTLALEFLDDFRPTAGQVFDVLKWNQRTGSFSSYTGLYAGKGIFLKPVYQADRLQLIATALPGLADLSVPGVPEAQQALDRIFSAIANQVAQPSISFDASLSVAGIRVSGTWDVGVALVTGGVETTFTARNVGADWATGDLAGALSGVSGRLVLAGSQLQVQLAGNGRLAFSSGDDLAGDFVLSGDSATGRLDVAASKVAARLGDAARGASLALSDGSLLMVLGNDGYAVRATGVGVLQGAPGSAFSGTLGYVANSFGRAVDVSIVQGGQTHRLLIDSPDRVQRFEARNASLTIADLGSLSGDFAFGARSSQTATTMTQELLVGARNVTASLTLGAASLTASRGQLGLVLATTLPIGGVGAATSQLALAGELDVSVAVDSTITLTGERVRVLVNRGAAALQREILSTGDVILLDIDANTSRLSGYFTTAIAGIIRFAGDLTLDVARSTRLLSNGQSVQLVEYALAGSRVVATVIPGGAGSELTASNADLALVYAKDVNSTRSWLTSRAVLSSVSVAGYALDNLESAALSLNRAADAVAVAEGTTLDWSATRSFVLSSGRRFVLDQVGDVLTLPVSGRIALGNNHVGGDFTLTYDRKQGFWDIQALDAQVLLAAGPAFVRLTQASGSLRLNADRTRFASLSGKLELGGMDGISLSGEGGASIAADGELRLSGSGVSLALAGFGTLSGDFSFIRINGPLGPRIQVAATGVTASVGTAGAGIGLSEGTLGLIVEADALGGGGYALVAGGTVTLNGFSDVGSFSATGQIAINRLGRALDETIGGVRLQFADERPLAAVKVDSGTLSVSGLGTLTGKLQIESQEFEIAGVRQQRLLIGFEQLSASVTLGGAAAILSGGRGAVILYKEVSGSGTVSRYAVQAEGAVALSGVSGVSLNADSMRITYNRTGAALDASVATSAGWVRMQQLRDETRLRGYAHAAVAGVLSFEGDLFLESAVRQAATLSNADSVLVDALLLGGTGLAARLESPAGDLLLQSTDLAMILSTERVSSGTARRWLTASAWVGGAEVRGFTLADINAAVLDINRALNTGSGAAFLDDAPVINWSGASSSRVIALNESRLLPLATAGERFVTTVSGSLALGAARLSGSFEIVRSTVNGSPVWEIRAVDASVAMTAGTARVGIDAVTGSLILAESGKSGQLVGTGSITGVDGLSFTGTLATRFNNDTLELAGDVELGVDGFGALAGQFAVVKEPVALSVPAMEQGVATPGAAGSGAETRAGGQASNSVLMLSVGGGGKLTREGVFGFVLDGQTQTASSLGDDERPVADAVFAARLQAALERLAAVGLGNVLVSGSRADGFRIEFAGTLAGKPVLLSNVPGGAGLWLEQPADPAEKSDWGLIEETQAASAGRNEVQMLTLANEDGAAGKAFTLGYAGQTTAAIPVYSTATASSERQVITLTAAVKAAGQFWFSLNGKTSSKVRYSADPTYHTAEIQAALEGLVGAGNVSVSYRSQYTGPNSIDYVVDFKNGMAGRDVALLNAFSSSSKIVLKPAEVRQGGPGFAVADQARAIQQALETLAGAGNVAVSFDNASSLASARYTVEFRNLLGSRDITPLLAATTASRLALGVATPTPGAGATGASQTVHLYDDAVVGTFRLGIVFGGASYTSADLPFDASVGDVRAALLAATTAEGARLAAAGVEVAVQLVATASGHAWKVDFGGAAAGVDLPVMQGRITSALPAPDARLTEVQRGATSDERQTLTIEAGGRYLLSIAGRAETSVPLDAGAGAAAVQAALEALPAVGSGNVAVTLSGGAYLVDFKGTLAGRDVGEILVSPVQTLSFVMADGEAPTSLALRLAGQPEWAAEIPVAGLGQSEIAAALRRAIGGLPNLNEEGVRVTAREGQAWRFDVAFVDALAGATPASLETLSTRIVEVRSERLLIGAAGVSGLLGSGTAGVALSGATLGLVLQRGADGGFDYALRAAGTAALSGLDGLVSLTASAEVRINALGKPVSESVRTGLSTPMLAVEFADGLARQEITISSGTVSVSGLGNLSGALKLVSTTRVEAGTTITDIAIGMENVSGSLTLGGAGAALSGGRGAILVRHELDAAGTATMRHAVHRQRLSGAPRRRDRPAAVRLLPCVCRQCEWRYGPAGTGRRLQP